MKKLLVITTVALFVIMTGSIALADTNTLTVNATLSGTCKFNTPTSTLSFTLDPSSSADATAQALPTFWCSRGVTLLTPTTNNGLWFSVSKRMRSAGHTTEFIPYSVALTPSSTTGLGKTNPITLTVDGTVLNADYVNALAATDYTDTVVITIAP